MTASLKKHASNFASSAEKITATRIQKIKRRAKDLAGRDGITHMEALDLVCAQEGLGSWESVIKLNSATPKTLAVATAIKQEPPPPGKLKNFEVYEAFAAEHIEYFEPRGDHFRIMRIGPAYFSLCVSYAEITLCSIDPDSVHKKTLKILDSVSLGPCRIDQPSEEDLSSLGRMARWFGQKPKRGLWICKYDSKQPRIWIGNLPGDLGLIALQRELGVGFGYFTRGRSQFLYENTTEQTGSWIGAIKKTAFESSSAYTDLIKWARQHPKKAKEESLRDHYMKGWYGKAKEMGFL